MFGALFWHGKERQSFLFIKKGASVSQLSRVGFNLHFTRNKNHSGVKGLLPCIYLSFTHLLINYHNSVMYDSGHQLCTVV